MPTRAEDSRTIEHVESLLVHAKIGALFLAYANEITLEDLIAVARDLRADDVRDLLIATLHERHPSHD